MAYIDESVEINFMTSKWWLDVLRAKNPNWTDPYDLLEQHALGNPSTFIADDPKWWEPFEPGDPDRLTYPEIAEIIRKVKKETVSLNDEIDQLKRDLSQILSKKSLGANDSVMIRGKVEICCRDVDKLRPVSWLDFTLTAGAMEVANKQDNVIWLYSIPLHEKRGEDIVLRESPLNGLRAKILKNRADLLHQGLAKWTYICPLNVHKNHFTLLEIDEEAKYARLYDSMAPQSTRERC
ncbi:hypothetical protein BX600DRAFT_438349 [Xylariales sp. PMI_506]|nr:hypothetical protein BX600DRAFT_438349 [Xylariales sp. PMI_506]